MSALSGGRGGASGRPGAAAAAGMAELERIAERAVSFLLERGAREAAATIDRTRTIECEVRERKVEQVKDAQSSGMTVAVYVDGRYSAHGTCDLGWTALEPFLERAVAMTRLLEPDPYRTLPEPRLYEGRSGADLDLVDPDWESADSRALKAIALEVEDAALTSPLPAGAAIQSVSASAAHDHVQRLRVASNGFRGRHVGTSASAAAVVTMREGDARPEEWMFVAARHRRDLGDLAAIGRTATARAVRRLGAAKIPGGPMKVIVENRTASQLLSHFLAAATGAAVQQKRSFLDGKVGARVMTERLTITDDPLIPRGLASRHFDGEGVSARRLPIVEDGVLRNFFIDTYYGKKLELAPTTGGPSNLVVAPGKRDLDALVRDTERAILVTSFIGGNSNSLTGDFSLGIQGALVERGERTRPVVELNLSGNHREFWDRLVEVGSDPWIYSSMRIPTLVFEGVSVSGM